MEEKRRLDADAINLQSRPLIERAPQDSSDSEQTDSEGMMYQDRQTTCIAFLRFDLIEGVSLLRNIAVCVAYD